jgi:hypothetical protein
MADEACAAGDQNIFPQNRVLPLPQQLMQVKSATVVSCYCCFISTNLCYNSIADASSS